jgi:hypothetical protein
MNAWTCADAEEHLELYAAGECEPDTRRALEAHLAGCASCRKALAEVRQVLGLLELRAREPVALWRLRGLVERDARRQRLRRLTVIGRRASALAALLLLTVGLAGWLPRPGGGPVPEPLQMVVELGSAGRGVPAAPARGGPEALKGQFNHEQVADVVRKDGVPVYHLDLDGRTPGEFRRALAARSRNLPPPPTVSLKVELRNLTGRTLEVGGAGAAVLLELHGPGAVSVPTPWVPAGVHLPRQAVPVPPQGLVPIEIRRLVSGGEAARYLYWTEPGDYTLTVRLRLPVRPETGAAVVGPVRTVTLSSPPLPLRVER